jgi:lysophospholipase L1-like esterase
VRRRFRWRVLFAGFAFSAALAVLTVEVLLRLLGISFPVFWRIDPLLGLTPNPGAQGVYVDEGRGRVSINSHGMRDVERTVAKASGTFRIAVLGDSFTEALQVDREQAFPALVEKALNERKAFGGKRVEVLNFGCSGYGTTQELLLLRHRVKAFAPDLVLLAFLPGNDLADNCKQLDPENRRPYFVRTGGKLVLDESFRESPYYRTRSAPLVPWLLDHLRIAQLANAVRLRMRRLPGAVTPRAGPIPERFERKNRPSPSPAPAPPPPARQPGIEEKVFMPPADPLWEEIWRTTEEVLVALRDEATAQGAKLAVVIVTDAMEVHPDPDARAELARALGVPDLLYPSRRLETFLTARGVPVLPLAAPFAEHADRTGEYLHGFANAGLGAGHWNDKAHRLAADLIAGFLTKN